MKGETAMKNGPHSAAGRESKPEADRCSDLYSLTIFER